MKKNILSIFLVVSMLLIFNTSDLYSGRRGCSGDKYCTACSSCSGCKHCAKEGGTCGVCYTPPKKEPKVKTEKDTIISDSLKVKRSKKK
ncbi:MAG: hypothetical protein WC121_06530 [Candidatus Kapaibacterium sp.]